jgi:hypothetical protein
MIKIANAVVAKKAEAIIIYEGKTLRGKEDLTQVLRANCLTIML